MNVDVADEVYRYNVMYVIQKIKKQEQEQEREECARQVGGE